MADDNKPDGQQYVSDSGLFAGLHPTMGIASKAMVFAFVIFTVLNVEFANTVYDTINNWIQTTLNWYYVSVVCILFFFSIWIMFSKYGRIRLGDDDKRPEFSRFSWFAMLFSAGVGIGLLPGWRTAPIVFQGSCVE